MEEGVPLIVFFTTVIPTLVLGGVFITYIYYRSREKQLMIEKGIPPEKMVELLKQKRSPYTMLKIGIVVFAFGLGLGLGMLIAEATDTEQWIAFLIITFTGTGFVAASLIGKRLEDRDKLNEKNLQ